MAALIRACLVEGYGNIAIDGITVAGEIATATITNNALKVGTVIEISGATPAELNAEWKITAADSSSITFSTPGIADVTATGTIGASIPAAGWEEPYPESGNYACFRAIKTGAKFYRINDNVDASATLMTMFDSMLDAVTGEGTNGSNYFGKYSSGKPTDWVVIADNVTCHVLLHGSRNGWAFHTFGEFYSYLPSDQSKEVILGYSVSGDFNFMSYSPLTYPTEIVSTSISRPGVLSSGLFSLSPRDVGVIRPTPTNDNYSLIPRLQTPYNGSYEYIVHPVRITAEGELAARGNLRGIYVPEATNPKADNTVFTHNERNYIAITINDLYTYSFQLFIDITGWEQST
jgi:hypothetical protein